MPQTVEGSILPMRAIALYDNNSETTDELSFKSGDILTVLEFDYSGLQGWWLCSIRGKQGICPGNRLKMLTEHDIGSPDSSKSWLNSSKVSVTPDKMESYFYDQPKATALPQIQYDVVPSTHPPVAGDDDAGGGDRYDVPRPLMMPPPSATTLTTSCLSPASSLGSIASDSNRSSSHVPQEYDVPKPAASSSARHHLPPKPIQVEQQPQEEYDVPREVPLELGPALEWLGRLEGEAAAAVRSVLGCAVSNWRRKEKLQPRLGEIRSAVHRLRMTLHDLVLFGRAALLNASNMQSGGGVVITNRLKPLLESLGESDSKVESCWRQLDSTGWTVESLCLEESYRTPGGDALDVVVATAAALQDDISRLASFIQGNATLLFRKTEEPTKTWTEDYDYVNIECKERQQDDGNAKNSISVDPADLKVLQFYGSQFNGHMDDLGSAVGSFITSVEQSQPPRVFLSLVKLILLSGHRLVSLADGASRSVTSKQVQASLLESADSLSDSLQATVRTTKEAALHFPNINNVQKMVNSVYLVSDLARKARHALSVQ